MLTLFKLKKYLKIKLLFLLLTTFLFSCNNEKKEQTIKTDKVIGFSIDTLKYILLTKEFPSEGWDFDKLKEIPVYYDDKFSVWTKDTSKFKNIIAALPQLDKEKLITTDSLGEYCSDHENFTYCHFIFTNSMTTYQEYNYNDCFIANGNIYRLKHPFFLDTIKVLFDKKAIHKQKFNNKLDKADSSEINLVYNKWLSRQKGNGLKIKDEYLPIYKSEWYYFEEE